MSANSSLALYLSAPQPCSYLDQQLSSSLFLDPQAAIDMPTYSRLLQHGFRRSGSLVYRPRCADCAQCQSVRIPVADFVQRRRHRRTLAANAQVQVISGNARFQDEHYRLYQRYTRTRHTGGSMAESSEQEYLAFLTADWCDTLFVEFREAGKLLGVAVTDQAGDGLSAVYTFFDPELASRSLGTFSVLAQLQLARQLGLPYLYLGYWIRDSAKMRYKADYRPIEIFRNERWHRYEQGQPIEAPETQAFQP